jgi:glycosyltransferase involved in cell wall biosynthesis
VTHLPPGAGFDVLHAFGSEPNVWFAVSHWRRNPAPLVISPVIVSSPGPTEWALRLATALPGPLTSTRMRRQLLRRADWVVCLTSHEQRLVNALAGLTPASVVVPNGVDLVDPSDLPDLPGSIPDEPFVLLLGGVSTRKRQREVVAALAGRRPVVVIGDWQGTAGEEVAFRTEVERGGGAWLGHVDDPALIQAIQRRAAGQALLSTAETQSLAVLEALAVGLPIVVSDIPSHRELAAAHPGLVTLATDPVTAAAALVALPDRHETRPAPIPTWDDVAGALEKVYVDVLEGPRRSTPAATSRTSRRSSGRSQAT